MALDTRWKDPQGKSPEHLHDAIVQIVRELRKGSYLPTVISDAAGISYDGTASGLAGNDVQAAIDEVEGRVDTLEAAPPPTHTLFAFGQITAQATLDVPLDDDTWDEVEIHLLNMLPATDNQDLLARLGQSAAFLSGASDYSWANNGGATEADAADAQINITGNGWGSGANETGTITVRVFRPTAASFPKSLTWSGNFFDAGANLPADISGGGRLLANTNALDAIRFFFPSGNIASVYYLAIGKKFS